jgi:hypothetical protein
VRAGQSSNAVQDREIREDAVVPGCDMIDPRIHEIL